MSHYLLDTNHVSALLGGNDLLRSRIVQHENQGSVFGISVTVLSELFFAVYASQRQEENLARLRDFLERVVLWPFDEAAAEMFGQMMAQQKRIGKPVPPVDAQIAAVAIVHGLVVLTRDTNFLQMNRLSVENWLD